MDSARFATGQVIHHRKFDYRGVITSVDPVFSGTDEWYEEVAKSRPPKDRPWYHVLVEGGLETYVAERHLEPERTPKPIDHPHVAIYFDEFRDGSYHLTRAMN